MFRIPRSRCGSRRNSKSRIDELFQLGEHDQKTPDSIAADVLSGSPAEKGQPVRVCQVGSRWVSVPVSASPYYMPEADGIIQHAERASRRAKLVVFAKDDAAAEETCPCRVRPCGQSPCPHGGEDQRSRDHSCGSVKQAGSDLAERREGPYCRLSPRGSQDWRIQPAVSSQGISGQGLSASSHSLIGKKASSWPPAIPNAWQNRGSGAQERPARQSRARFRQPRPSGPADGQCRHRLRAKSRVTIEWRMAIWPRRTA